MIQGRGHIAFQSDGLEFAGCSAWAPNSAMTGWWLSVQSPLESILGRNCQPSENPVRVQAAALARLFPKSALTHPA